MSFRRGRSHRRRKHQGKTGSGARLAGYLDLSSVLFHDLLDDGKTDSGARLAGFLRLFRAVELAEDLLDLFLVHADPLILDGDPNASSVLPTGDRYFGALGRVFHRVGK